jgi:hypothetical protein
MSLAINFVASGSQIWTENPMMPYMEPIEGRAIMGERVIKVSYNLYPQNRT